MHDLVSRLPIDKEFNLSSARPWMSVNLDVKGHTLINAYVAIEIARSVPGLGRTLVVSLVTSQSSPAGQQATVVVAGLQLSGAGSEPPIFPVLATDVALATNAWVELVLTGGGSLSGRVRGTIVAGHRVGR